MPLEREVGRGAVRAYEVRRLEQNVRRDRDSGHETNAGHASSHFRCQLIREALSYAGEAERIQAALSRAVRIGSRDERKRQASGHVASLVDTEDLESGKRLHASSTPASVFQTRDSRPPGARESTTTDVIVRIDQRLLLSAPQYGRTAGLDRR